MDEEYTSLFGNYEREAATETTEVPAASVIDSVIDRVDQVIEETAPTGKEDIISSRGPQAPVKQKPAEDKEQHTTPSFTGGDGPKLNEAAYTFDIDSLPEKPWTQPGVDPSEYFNYGFSEQTWKLYCQVQNGRRGALGRFLKQGKPLEMGVHEALQGIRDPFLEELELLAGLPKAEATLAEKKNHDDYVESAALNRIDAAATRILRPQYQSGFADQVEDTKLQDDLYFPRSAGQPENPPAVFGPGGALGQGNPLSGARLRPASGLYPEGNNVLSIPPSQLPRSTLMAGRIDPRVNPVGRPPSGTGSQFTSRTLEARSPVGRSAAYPRTELNRDNRRKYDEEDYTVPIDGEALDRKSPRRSERRTKDHKSREKSPKRKRSTERDQREAKRPKDKVDTKRSREREGSRQRDRDKEKEFDKPRSEEKTPRKSDSEKKN